MDNINNNVQPFANYNYHDSYQDHRNFIVILDHFRKCFNQKKHLHSRDIFFALEKQNIYSKYEKIKALKALEKHYYRQIDNIYFIYEEKYYFKKILSKIDFCLYKIKNEHKKEEDFIHKNYQIRKMIAKNHSYKRRYDPDYMNISTKEIFLEQDSEDCFCVSFLQIFLMKIKNINLAKYVKYYGDITVLLLPDSCYRVNYHIERMLEKYGYKAESNSKGFLVKLLIPISKMTNIRHSNGNVIIKANPDKITGSQKNRLNDFITMISHLNGRITLCEQESTLNSILEASNASMESYGLRRGDPSYFAELLGYKEKHIISIYDFMRKYSYIKDLLENGKILATLGVYYNVKEKYGRVGHSLSIIGFDEASLTFDIYNPHGKSEKYHYNQLLSYEPMISIFISPDFKIDEFKNLKKIEQYIYSVNPLPKHQDHQEINIYQLPDKTLHYKTLEQMPYFNKYKLLSGVHQFEGRTFIFDSGELVRSDVTFISLIENGEIITKQFYRNQLNQVVLEDFSGIYQGKYYESGHLKTDHDSNYLLCPDTEDDGNIIDDSAIVYDQY